MLCHAQGSTNGAGEPLLLRAARGQEVERSPVWLMRQAGRYMKAFKAISDAKPFRERSETAEIAIELSLQPFRAFGPDGVIMFSDILTILPAMGVDFTMVKGRGPVIPDPVQSEDRLREVSPLEDPASSLPFIATILGTLREEVGSQATVLGFIGTPWTLAAYCVEGGSPSPHLQKVKGMMYRNPAMLHTLLARLTDSLVTYVCYQIQSGAQVVQLFDSWARHLTPGQFRKFSMPYAEEVICRVKEQHPDVPLIFHANGGTGKDHIMNNSSADVLGLDTWADMALMRERMPNRILQGNVDPSVLVSTPDAIEQHVHACIAEAGNGRHILNVGDGVFPSVPEENVGHFIRTAKSVRYSTSREPALSHT